MKTIQSPLTRGIAVLLCGLLATGPALADKPSWAGGGKHEREDGGNGHGKHGGRGDDDHGPGAKHGGGHDWREGDRYFTDDHRVVLNNYFASEFSHGKCPPGLAKKNNGCLPPGQAKKWAVGQPLPRDVVYYPLPATVITQIGRPPAGYQYVRVASDILMIAVGTSMVVDAIQDLGR